MFVFTAEYKFFIPTLLYIGRIISYYKMKNKLFKKNYSRIYLEIENGVNMEGKKHIPYRNSIFM